MLEWKTVQPQNLLSVRTCGFDSHPPHHSTRLHGRPVELSLRIPRRALTSAGWELNTPISWAFTWAMECSPILIVAIGGFASRWMRDIPPVSSARSGPKHKRPISLEDWQWLLVKRHSQELVKGLIQSDGCRATNRIRIRGRLYEYPRYFFSNRSDEIRAIFSTACGLFGVESRPNNRYNVSVARRRSVEILDSFIGPKPELDRRHHVGWPTSVDTYVRPAPYRMQAEGQ